MDSARLQQVIVNLLSNAAYAMRGIEGAIEVRMAPVDLDFAMQIGRSLLLPGTYIRIEVKDRGSGMAQETLDRLFEPFFTTKPKGQGTGLGLATVYGIVKQNDGYISVDSEPGKGSAFKIYLPRFGGDALKPAAEGMVQMHKGRGELVLLVEDEAAILTVGKAMLERLGYAVVTAGTPAEALRQADAHAEKIRLLITDVIMPGMNGLDLARKIHETNPGLKCLFTSGYTADVIAHHGVLDEGVQFIQKPFSLRALASKVHQALTERCC
jgi:CheY-like chemotaxis protein